MVQDDASPAAPKPKAGGGGCCRDSECVTVFEPCPCTSPVWTRTWRQHFDLPEDLWRSGAANRLECPSCCWGGDCAAVALCLYRLAALGYCVTIWFLAYHPGDEQRLANDLESFTMQNFTLLCCYFLLSAAWSCYGVAVGEAMLRDDRQAIWKRWSCGSRFLMKLTVVLFEVCLVNAAFLDVVFWTLLQPIWTVRSIGSIGLVNGSVHGLNFVLLLIELLLNQLEVSSARHRKTVVPVHMWFGFFYALFYLFWAMIYFAWRGRWIYDFLDWSKDIWPAFYVGIPVLWILCFACWVPLSRTCRRRSTKARASPATTSGYSVPSVDAFADEESISTRRGSVQAMGPSIEEEKDANTVPLLGGDGASDSK